MGIRKYLDEMRSVRDEIHEHKAGFPKPDRMKGMRGFSERARNAVRLVRSEPEILLFALLQWVSVALGYFLWIQMLDWIPESVWETAADADGASVVDLILLLWSMLCVGLVAFPLGILSACMGAVHFLHRQDRDSSVARCLRLVLPNAWAIWIFSWIDGWWTVMRILDRLPKRNDSRTLAEKALSEALYQAWKMGTMGMLPAMITGKGLVPAGRQSVRFVTTSFVDVGLLRVGYSGLCWVVGIAAYIGTILFLAVGPGGYDPGNEISSTIYLFYFWAGVPLVVAVGVVLLVIRPVYLLSACDLYSKFLEWRGEEVELAPAPGKGISALVAVAVLALVLAVVFVYRDELGISALLATPYS